MAISTYALCLLQQKVRTQHRTDPVNHDGSALGCNVSRPAGCGTTWECLPAGCGKTRHGYRTGVAGDSGTSQPRHPPLTSCRCNDTIAATHSTAHVCGGRNSVATSTSGHHCADCWLSPHCQGCMRRPTRAVLTSTLLMTQHMICLPSLSSAHPQRDCEDTRHVSASSLLAGTAWQPAPSRTHTQVQTPQLNRGTRRVEVQVGSSRPSVATAAPIAPATAAAMACWKVLPSVYFIPSEAACRSDPSP
jgi:hypothetical protein